MIKQPYRIVIVPPVSREPTVEQMNWMVRRLRMLAACATHLGLEGDCIRVYVYPMSRGLEGKLPHWAAHWRRPEHSVIEALDQVHAWGSDPEHTVREIISVSADEVWCLNSGGHSSMSPCPQARVWRAAQGLLVLAARFKLVPSWVDSAEPDKPAKKERKSEADGTPRNHPTSRKAGRGQARGRPGNASDRGYPRRYP